MDQVHGPRSMFCIPPSPKYKVLYLDRDARKQRGRNVPFASADVREGRRRLLKKVKKGIRLETSSRVRPPGTPSMPST